MLQQTGEGERERERGGGEVIRRWINNNRTV